jgi:hypothetical protein
MTMYVVAGQGEMPAADLKATLDEQENTAVQEDRTFWLLVQASAEPTATDRALMSWITAHETYFETYGPDAAKPDPIYAGSQEKHVVKGITAKILQLLEEKPENGEDARLFALYANEDVGAPEDAELDQLVAAVLGAGYPVFAFNDGMGELTLNDDSGDDGAAEETEETEETAEEVEVEAEEWTREALEALSGDDVRVIAAELGIVLPPRTRTATYITAILDRDKEEETAEVEIAAPEVEDVNWSPLESTNVTGAGPGTVQMTGYTTNGHSTEPYDIVKAVLRALGEALLAASQ